MATKGNKTATRSCSRSLLWQPMPLMTGTAATAKSCQGGGLVFALMKTRGPPPRRVGCDLLPRAFARGMVERVGHPPLARHTHSLLLRVLLRSVPERASWVRLLLPWGPQAKRRQPTPPQGQRGTVERACLPQAPARVTRRREAVTGEGAHRGLGAGLLLRAACLRVPMCADACVQLWACVLWVHAALWVVPPLASS